MSEFWACKQISKEGKYLVVNKLVQILNEDVALTSFAKGRVTLGPHDPAKDGKD